MYFYPVFEFWKLSIAVHLLEILTKMGNDRDLAFLLLLYIYARFGDKVSRQVTRIHIGTIWAH